MLAFRPILLLLIFALPAISLANAIEVINQGLEAANQGDFEQAESLYSEAIHSGELSGKSLAYAYRVRGNLHYGNAQYNNAINDFGKAIELNPEDEVALNNRGSTWFVLGNFDKAVSDYSKSLKINPNKAQTFHNRSLIYFELQEYKLSIEDSNKSLELREANVDAYINRGSSWFALGNLDNAIRDYSSALNVDPTNANAYYNRSVVFTELNQLDNAMGDIDQAVYYNPQDPGVYAHRAQLWKALNEIEKSKKDYQIAITYADKYGESFRNLLQAELAGLNADNLMLQISDSSTDETLNSVDTAPVNNYTQLIDDINVQLLQSPNNIALLKKRGWLHFYDGQFEGAMTDFKHVLTSNPKDIYRLLWIYIVAAHQQEDPLQTIQNLASNRNLDKWPGSLVRFYLGQINEQKLLDMISVKNSEKSSDKILGVNCEAFYYLGEYHLNLGAKDKARKYFEKAIETGKSSFTEYKNAQFQLNRI